MMTRRMTWIPGLIAAAAFAGCGEVPQPAANGSGAQSESAEASGGGATAELSEAEITALAEEQKVCAVSGEPLGSMGGPVPVSVTDSEGKSHTVLICCDSCEGTLKEDPDKYLAKLNEAPKEQPEQPGT